MKNIEIKQMKENVYDIPSYKSSNSYSIFRSGKTSSALYVLKEGSFILITPDIVPTENTFFISKGNVEVNNGKESIYLRENDSFKTSSLTGNIRAKAIGGPASIFASAFSDEQLGIDEYEISSDLIKKLEEKDIYTVGHSKRVCYYAIEIAMVLNNPEIDMYSLCRAAILHDIGKTNIPDEVLNKPGKYTAEEFNVMKKHPLYSYDMASNFSSPKIQRMIIEHHERLNGTGYPNHLKEDQIDDGSKVLMVADVFDALTSSRIYRKAFSVEDALKIIDKETSQGLYDPKVVSALKKCIHDKLIEVNS